VQGGQTCLQAGTVARTEQLPACSAGAGEKPEPVQLGRGRDRRRAARDLREEAGGELRKLAARIGGGAGPLIPLGTRQLAHALNSRRLRHFRRETAALPAADFEQQLVARFAALPPNRVAMAARGGMPASARSWRADIAVAHPAGRFHQLRELAPDLFPRVVGEEPGENVQAAAQAADGDAQVVDGIGSPLRAARFNW